MDDDDSCDINPKEISNKPNESPSQVINDYNGPSRYTSVNDLNKIKENTEKFIEN